MKKQFNYYETTSFRFCLNLYHDGKLVSCEKLWTDELNDRIWELEEEGYIYGYNKEKVEEARQRYECALANMIEESE